MRERKLEDMNQSTQIFLSKMYTYLGEDLGNNEGHYIEEFGIQVMPYPFEDFVSSLMGRAAARAFDELTTS